MDDLLSPTRGCSSCDGLNHNRGDSFGFAIRQLGEQKPEAWILLREVPQLLRHLWVVSNGTMLMRGQFFELGLSAPHRGREASRSAGVAVVPVDVPAVDRDTEGVVGGDETLLAGPMPSRLPRPIVSLSKLGPEGESPGAWG
jgi:hypothetical protein